MSLDNVHALLRLLPELPAGKIVLTILLLLNIRAFPFVWHVRVFRPVYSIYLQRLLLSIRTLFLSRKAKKAAIHRWMESLSPIGLNPFSQAAAVTYTSWASIDESDYNLHLSNSSYAKALDGARFKAAMKWCPQFFRAGGKMALGGTSFGFLREIPIMRGYEVRISIGGWDEKWFYIICRFVTVPKGKGKGEGKKKRHEATNGSFLQAPIIDTTPGSSSFTSTPIPPNTNGKLDIKTLTSRLTATHEEPDGAILHTVSISQMCCKIGRITVPPELVLATNGMYATNGSEAYSQSNPPPHWSNVQALIESNGLTALYKGGWKDVPVEERWWNTAMGGMVEEQRKERMETLGLLRRCMDGAKGIR
ncbi:hypothetical protein V5O48_015599 [Marasmius crinis-equi]|uniref:Uncharacterized protein n=1 Tax=Marasmius crinis-equi TaxID=585013 RepID=A0ABR3EU23_9AGAR